MALFDNGETEEFLLFIRNFQMTLEASGTFAACVKIQYLHTLLNGKALRQLDILFVEARSMTIEHLNRIILSLVTHFLPVNALSRKKCVMHLEMRKLHRLKVRCYTARM